MRHGYHTPAIASVTLLMLPYVIACRYAARHFESSAATPRYAGSQLLLITSCHRRHTCRRCHITPRRYMLTHIGHNDYATDTAAGCRHHSAATRGEWPALEGYVMAAIRPLQ